MRDPLAGVEVKEVSVNGGTLPPGVRAYQVNVRFEDGEVMHEGRMKEKSEIMGFGILAESEQKAVEILHGRLTKCLDTVLLQLSRRNL
jgi:hypothetical protein